MKKSADDLLRALQTELKKNNQFLIPESISEDDNIKPVKPIENEVSFVRTFKRSKRLVIKTIKKILRLLGVKRLIYLIYFFRKQRLQFLYHRKK